MKAYKWISLDYYHQKPREFEEVIITDGNKIYYEVCWLNECKKLPCKEGWYYIDGVAPLDITPTHWMKLDLP